VEGMQETYGRHLNATQAWYLRNELESK